MDIGLFQQQTTQISMTSELKQAIEILEYSYVDVRKYLEEKSMSNPLIDLKEASYPNPLCRSERSYNSQKTYQVIENYAKSKSLKEMLIDQLVYYPGSNSDKIHIHYLIEHVNDDGYLTISTEDFTNERHLTHTQAEDYMNQLQTLDPPGIGARNIKECLFLQLRQLNQRSKLTEDIVENHLESLAELNLRKLANTYNVHLYQVQEALDTIRDLNPYPGRNYSHTQTEYIEADVSILVDKNGEIVIQMNDTLLGFFQVNQYYKRLLENESSDHAIYAKEMMREVDWLSYSLTRRQDTIRRIVEVIAEYQKPFLTEKQNRVNPLTLKEVAIHLGIHESTVSRATTNKYVQTPKGLIELKTLFSSNHQSFSKDLLKSWLIEFIKTENKHNPLSDQEIVTLFEKKNVHLSRRVISKYRAELKILSSTKRKRYL